MRHFQVIVILVGLWCAVQARFYVGDRNRTYNDAMTECSKRRYFLITPHFVEKNKEIYEIMRENNLTRVWIGISRQHRNSDRRPWNWKHAGPNRVNKAEPSFWGPGEPNNFQGHRERCVEIRDLLKNNELHDWNDRPCDSLNPFICEDY